MLAKSLDRLAKAWSGLCSYSNSVSFCLKPIYIFANITTKLDMATVMASSLLKYTIMTGCPLGSAHTLHPAGSLTA